MGLGGGALGLIYLHRQTLEAIRRQPSPPISGDDPLGLQGNWQLAGIGRDKNTFPAEIISRIMNQTWEFGADGQLTIKTLGLRKILTYSINGREITTRDPLRGNSRRLEIVSGDPVNLVLRSVDPPQVEYSLERMPGVSGP